MNREILNNYIKNNQINNLTDYLSNYLNLHKEKLYIKLINNFETNSITIDNLNEFVIILNNSIHDEIIVNNTKFEETLLINDSSNILINTNLTYIDITYILIQNVFKKNSIEYINKYFLNDNIFLINDSNIFNHDDCKFIKRFIDKSIENNSIENNFIDKITWNSSYNTQSLGFIISKEVNNPNKILNKKVDNLVFNVIKRLISHLKEENQIARLKTMKGDTGYQFRKIFGETRLHFDGIKCNKNDTKDTNERFLSIILCLNDDYEGGEICFPVQNRSIKMKKGDILAFPTYWTHPHYSNDLLNKTYRYTINTWLY
tara:strand:- start:2141 stop:3088 length:948 start_codon:yes stop_codon:yes gene_type:complete